MTQEEKIEKLFARIAVVIVICAILAFILICNY
jgi:hypothetical protein